MMEPGVAGADEAQVALLQEMGFSVDQCREALRLSSNQTELAMEWLLQQAHIASSPAMSGAEQSPGAEESFMPDQDAVAMLKGMGFGEEAVTMALRATNNDPDEACSWLMDSAGDANGEISGLVAQDDSGDSLSQSMQDELDGWQASSEEHRCLTGAESISMTTPAQPLVSTMPSMSTHTPAPPGTEPGAMSQRGTSPVRRGHSHIESSGFTVPPSASSPLHTTDAGMDHDESSFAIQRPATSPRGSTIQRRPMLPGSRVSARVSNGAGTAAMHRTPATNNCGITPNNLFHQRTESQLGTTGPSVPMSSSGGAVTSAAFSGGFSHTASNTPRGEVSGTLFSPPDQLGDISDAQGSSVRSVQFSGLDHTLDLNSSSATVSGGDTPGLLKDLQGLSNRARAAEEMAVALQTEVEQQMMRNEMLGRQLQDERAANASISKQLRQALLQKQGAVDGGTDRLGCGAGPIPSAQRQAERAHLAAFMSRRLVL